ARSASRNGAEPVLGRPNDHMERVEIVPLPPKGVVPIPAAATARGVRTLQRQLTMRPAAPAGQMELDPGNRLQVERGLTPGRVPCGQIPGFCDGRRSRSYIAGLGSPEKPSAIVGFAAHAKRGGAAYFRIFRVARTT